MEYRGVSYNIMEYLGISWNILEYHRILRNVMEYLGMSWNIMEYHGILWNTPEASKAWIWARRLSRGYPDLRLLGGVSWMTLAYAGNRDRRVVWNVMEYY